MKEHRLSTNSRMEKPMLNEVMPSSPLVGVPGTARNSTELIVEKAWQASTLGRLDKNVLDKIRRDSTLVRVPAGQPIYRGNGTPRLALMVSGLARVLVSSPDGRRATIKYIRSGEFTGMVWVVTQNPAMDSEAVSDSFVLFLNVERFTKIAMTHPDVAWAISLSIGAVTSEVVNIAVTNVFGSIRRRVARHLLDLAQVEAGQLIVRADQQDIADSVGSVREVVARSMRSLRDDGHIGWSGSRGLAILNAPGLHLVARGTD
jgi:CRP-like cAMP-binding protein